MHPSLKPPFQTPHHHPLDSTKSTTTSYVVSVIRMVIVAKSSSLIPSLKPKLTNSIDLSSTQLRLESSNTMLDIWSWICELPNLSQWPESDTSVVFNLASSGPSNGNSATRSIQLRAERVSGSNIDTLVTFSVCLHGFVHLTIPKKTLWVSDTCSFSSDKPFLPLLLQLLQEIISRSPTSHDSTCPRSQLHALKPDPLSWVMDSHSPESFSSFFDLVFVTRLFWLCACDAPSEVGSLYFKSILVPNLEGLMTKHAPALRTFLITVGVDAELCFMRTLGYMLAKWCMLRHVGVGLQTITALAAPTHQNLGFSYANEAGGYWMLKGYAPVLGMRPTRGPITTQFPGMETTKDAVVKYALAHQQLEALLQLEYSVRFYDSFIHVTARVDNLRFHVVNLGFKNNKSGNDDVEFEHEKYFPSRIRLWVGPEVGANYVHGLSLGRSTADVENEVKMERVTKGSFGNKSNKKVKTAMRMSTRTRRRNWRWDQDAEGNAAVFDAVLCDSVTGNEIATCKTAIEGEGESSVNGLRRRYEGGNRAFTKTGSLVLSGDEYGDVVGWRLSREMEGSVFKWRIGGKVWVSYLPNEVTSTYCETRCVEWCDEVDLPLILGKITV